MLAFSLFKKGAFLTFFAARAQKRNIYNFGDKLVKLAAKVLDSKIKANKQ